MFLQVLVLLEFGASKEVEKSRLLSNIKRETPKECYISPLMQSWVKNMSTIFCLGPDFMKRGPDGKLANDHIILTENTIR